MLLAILLISLLIYAWTLFSEYQSTKDELADIEDTAKFNEQFANYDREGVQGYELLSLINQVIDYNYRKSNDTAANSDEKYKPITIKIDMNARQNVLVLDNGVNKLFTKPNYTQSSAKQNNDLEKILEKVKKIQTRYGGDDCATRIAKSINFNTIGNNTNLRNEAIQKFNAYSNNMKVNDWAGLLSEQDNIYTYYEYVQFKRGLFDSVAEEIDYDSATGRICQMVFKFTGKIH